MVHSLINGQVLSADGQVLFRQINIDGAPYWQASSGRTFPVVAGAEDPPVDPNSTNDDGTGEPAGSASEDAFDKDRALATIRKQRDEAKALKIQLKELEALKAEKAERELADKSEAEKLRIKLEAAQAAIADKEAALKRVGIERAIEIAAHKHKARDSAMVAKLVDHEAIQFDDDGSPSNVEELVKKLLSDAPYLVTADADPDPPRSGAQGVPPTPRSSGAIKREDRVKQNEEKLIATRQYTPIG